MGRHWHGLKKHGQRTVRPGPVRAWAVPGPVPCLGRDRGTRSEHGHGPFKAAARGGTAMAGRRCLAASSIPIPNSKSFPLSPILHRPGPLHAPPLLPTARRPRACLISTSSCCAPASAGRRSLRSSSPPPPGLRRSTPAAAATLGPRRHRSSLPPRPSPPPSDIPSSSPPLALLCAGLPAASAVLPCPGARHADALAGSCLGRDAGTVALRGTAAPAVPGLAVLGPCRARAARLATYKHGSFAVRVCTAPNTFGGSFPR
ncbi:proline-rich receptor-like protein kinase PERK8 [Panicum virgatum]|uniref:proline-rich receptor-like protein kinase PERK8 n=1 Tax=Panicum virgatum TaxID=38727 RepID=UPI0019D58134|nr:proline-rich receptor-like protein kinase PERK8 [Panicum virgatum]